MRCELFLWISVLGIVACGRCLAAPTNVLSKTDYAFFATIPERNIFNPIRLPHREPPTNHVETVVAAPTDAFALVGTMTYEKGTFAFFSGASTNYQKVLQRDGEIAGFKIASITPDAVTLATSNSTVIVRVGSQMQCDRVAGWTQAQYATTQMVDQATAPVVPPATDSAGSSSDILKKLMQKREQEL